MFDGVFDCVFDGTFDGTFDGILDGRYDFEKGSFFLGLFVWNMLFAQGILFVVVFIVSYVVMNQLLRMWLWEHAWELFVMFGLPPLIALIQACSRGR